MDPGGVILLLLIGLPAMAVWFNTTYPQASDRMCTAYRTRGTRCFILGAGIVIVGFFLAALLGSTKMPPLGVLALLILVTLGVQAAAGYAIALRVFGERLVSDPATANRAKTVVLGGIVMEVAFFTPVLGQLLLLSVLFRGVGAAVTTLLARGSTPAEAEPPAPSEAEA